jgi:endogenous inhibitor of DNA gyrase (YacG/DUF329 family)
MNKVKCPNCGEFIDLDEIEIHDVTSAYNGWTIKSVFNCPECKRTIRTNGYDVWED